MRALLLTFFLCYHVDDCLSKASSTGVLIANLAHEWRVFDEEKNQFFPYIKGDASQAIYFEVDHEIYSGFNLQIKLPEFTYLYLNARLFKYAEKAQFYELDIDSLAQRYHGELLFSCYSDNPIDEKIESKVVGTNKVKGQSLSKQLALTETRTTYKGHDFLIVLSIFGFGMLLTFRSLNHRLFSEYFSIISAISVRQRFDAIVAQSNLSRANLSFVILYAFLIAGAVALILTFSPDALDHVLWLGHESILLSAVFTFFLVLAISLLKFPYLTLINSLFHFRKIRDQQYYCHVRISLIMSLAIFALGVVNGILHGNLISNHDIAFGTLLQILLWGRVVIIFLVLNSQLNFYKLHIIAYLCSTEIIPLLIFLKFLLK